MEPVDEQEAEAQHLRRIAWLAGEFYDACRAARLPDDLGSALVTEWHRSILDPDYEWSADGDDD
jgi:hypothetical protein